MITDEPLRYGLPNAFSTLGGRRPHFGHDQRIPLGQPGPGDDGRHQTAHSG
jgi:hypothetical protein